MNTLALAWRLSVLCAVMGQLGSAVYTSEVRKLCLYCPVVSHPHECQTFTKIWPHERCSTERLLLHNGSTVYTFGYKPVADCVHSNSLDLHDARQRHMPSTDISLCQECCTESLCNRKLCGIPESNNTNLACLTGTEVRGMPADTSITYCQGGEQCYAGIPNHVRPNHLKYGCASRHVCNQLRMSSTDRGSSTLCQACCSQDGCNAHICDSQLQDPQKSPASVIDRAARTTTYTDCWDLRSRGGFTENTEYDIHPDPAQPSTTVRVRCDMTTDGGGWIIFQRRYDGSQNFTQTFQEYKEGFGVLTGEYWLGLDWIHTLTSQPNNLVHLRVDLCSFAGLAGFAVWERFNISGPSDTYRLHVATYRSGSSIDDWMTAMNSSARLTFEATGRCAEWYKGGWWYHGLCWVANLNGGKYRGGNGQGIWWERFGGSPGSAGSTRPNLRSSEMKIRPATATGDSSSAYTCPT